MKRPAIILLDPKQDLFEAARDWALTIPEVRERTIVWDPRDESTVLGFNPLRPSHLPVIDQAKATTDALLAAWDQHSVNATPRLGKYLFLSIVAARLMERDLCFALDVLRVRSGAKHEAAEYFLKHPEYREIGEALEEFSTYLPTRQEELAESSVSRLQRFVFDPKIRRVLTQKERCLDLRSVMDRGELLLVNLGKHTAYRPQDLQTIGKLLINSIAAEAFHRADRTRRVVVIIDECQDLATEDLMSCLDQGAGLNVTCILAHQYPSQFSMREGLEQIWRSILTDARMKICFSIQDPRDLELMAETICLDRHDPRQVRNEEMQKVTKKKDRGESHGFQIGFNAGIQGSAQRTTGRTLTASEAITDSLTLGESRGRRISISDTASKGETRSLVEAHGEGETESNVSVAGAGTGVGASATVGQSVTMVDGTAELIPVEGSGEFSSNVLSTAEAIGHGRSRSRVLAHGLARSRATAKTKTIGEDESESRQVGRALQTGVSAAENEGNGTSLGFSLGIGVGYDYKRSTSEGEVRAPLSKEEFLSVMARTIRELPVGHFVMRTPHGRSRFLRAPFVESPEIDDEVREQHLNEMKRNRRCFTPLASVLRLTSDEKVGHIETVGEHHTLRRERDRDLTD